MNASASTGTQKHGRTINITITITLIVNSLSQAKLKPNSFGGLLSRVLTWYVVLVNGRSVAMNSTDQPGRPSCRKPKLNVLTVRQPMLVGADQRRTEQNSAANAVASLKPEDPKLVAQDSSHPLSMIALPLTLVLTVPFSPLECLCAD